MWIRSPLFIDFLKYHVFHIRSKMGTNLEDSIRKNPFLLSHFLKCMCHKFG